MPAPGSACVVWLSNSLTKAISQSPPKPAAQHSCYAELAESSGTLPQFPLVWRKFLMPFDIRAKVSKSVYDFLLYTQSKVSTKAIILTHTPSVHTVTPRRLHNIHCVKLCK